MNIYSTFNSILSALTKIIVNFNLETAAGEKLYQTALSCLGKDVAPKENEYGCAEAVNNVVFKAFGDYAGGDLSTKRMYLALKNHKKFSEVSSPKPGDIILSPTGYGNGNLSNGHTGIVGQGGKIMSNNSINGLFEENFTIENWNHRYKNKGGFPVLFYRRIIA